MNAQQTNALPYKGTGRSLPDTPYEERSWPEGPRWRSFDGGPPMPEPPPEDEADRRLGPVTVPRQPPPDEVRLVNAAILLRRPLLVTGRPGVGKSALAYRIARELGLGRVLQWPITSRTSLTSGLYEYDAIGRAQSHNPWLMSAAQQQPTADEAAADIGDFIQLGPLGTALLPYRLPRVLLIDEIDKGDADLPNDLLTLFEDGWYAVPPLVRVRKQHPRVTVHTADPGGFASVAEGVVTARAFPIVIMTSNGERAFPEAFMRRCLRLDMADLDAEGLAELLSAHFSDRLGDMQGKLIRAFKSHSEESSGLAADMLLNAAHLVTSGAYTYAEGDDAEWQSVLSAIWHPLNADGAGRSD
ncbi:MoxR family ATPase [Streptomyces sp. NPDC006997]|uniref:AAA family ATPase n=1 Tax=Streptomyces sp. NPDC006997 TaxID=3155356 RepID=UPI0033EC95A6